MPMMCPNCGKKTLTKRCNVSTEYFLCCRCWKSAPLHRWKSYSPKR